LLPEAKFVFVLRDSIKRAYSNWLWSTFNQLETLPFAEALALEGRRLSPLPPERSYARPFDYMTRARYGSFAAAWIKAVGRERIAFYIFETVIKNPEPFAAHLQRFIGTEALSWDELRTGRINANPLEGTALDPVLVEALRKQIAPEMERLAKLTTLDVSVWGFQSG